MKGSVTLVAMLSRSGELQVSVEDTGIGIPADKLQSIFTMFGKVGNNDLNPQGCGLGLNISSMLVGKLGNGTIQVSSVPQAGSIFSFKLPITPGIVCDSYLIQNALSSDALLEIPNEQIAVPNSAYSNPSLSLSYAQVLIVDDAPFNRLVLRKILTAMGYNFAEASTGLEAVSMVRGACDRGSPFSVVLMDIEMPEMDGITATRELLDLVNRGVLGSIPVIIGCSAFSSEEDKAAALAAGMTDYLEKPISRSRLLELMSLYCRREN